MKSKSGASVVILAAFFFLVTLTGAVLQQVNTTTAQSLYNKTYVDPIFSGTITGTYTIGSGLTITSPTITGPTFSGTASGSLTNLTLVTPALGVPSALTLTNATGLPVSTGITGFGANVAAFLATPSSANFFAMLTGGTGSGAPVFGTGPTLSSPVFSGSLTGTYTIEGTPTYATDLSVSVSDSRTNTVDVPATLTSSTSGSAAAGIGTGLRFQAKSADESPSDFGQINATATDIASGSEDTYFSLLIRVAGNALTEAYRFVATTTNKAIFTHANSADRTYTLPDATGTVPTVATQAEVNAMTSTTTALSPNHNKIVVGTAQATTSGTAFTFSSVPSGVRRVNIQFAGVSLSATADLLVQIGPVAGVETSGYVSSSTSFTTSPANNMASSTAGFIVRGNTAVGVLSGILRLELIDASTNQWVASGSFKSTTTLTVIAGGDKSLAGELSVVKILNDAADTFDAGKVNISYER